MNKVLLIIILCWSTSLLEAASSSTSCSKSNTRITWSEEEDAALIQIMENNQEKKPWTEIAQLFLAKTKKSKTEKQCQERWLNHLDPTLSKDHWTGEEFETLRKAHAILGNKWAETKKQDLPHRSER